ncbi:MAG TPA: hypothetical protein VG963_14400 [Polyangiaceae bacterium]|nr:hypothetical protein [Polyangiaceae bacterium]
MTGPANSVYRWWARFALGACALLASSGRAHADEPTLSEVKYHTSEQPPAGTGTRIVLTGLGITAFWYGAGVATSYAWPHAPNARDLRIPVVGPWMALGDIGCGAAEGHCPKGLLVLRSVFAVLSGIGQVGGLAMATEGLFTSTSSGSTAAGTQAGAHARSDGGDHTEASHDEQRGTHAWAAVPVVLPDGAALTLIGRF